jgi:hypothetical protein
LRSQKLASSSRRKKCGDATLRTSYRQLFGKQRGVGLTTIAARHCGRHGAPARRGHADIRRGGAAAMRARPSLRGTTCSPLCATTDGSTVSRGHLVTAKSGTGHNSKSPRTELPGCPRWPPRLPFLPLGFGRWPAEVPIRGCVATGPTTKVDHVSITSRSHP